MAIPRDYTWYKDEAKRLEVVVWFLERSLNKNRSMEPGSVSERRDRVVKTLQSRHRGRYFENIMKILSMRAGSFGYSLIASETGLKKDTVKQLVRRLDRAAYELFCEPILAISFASTPRNKQK